MFYPRDLIGDRYRQVAFIERWPLTVDRFDCISKTNTVCKDEVSIYSCTLYIFIDDKFIPISVEINYEA